MADYDQIMKALRNAHAAGDAVSAKRLAAMARAAQQPPSAAPVASQAVPAMGMPANPVPQENGPGVGGPTAMRELTDQGILPRRFVAGDASGQGGTGSDVAKSFGSGLLRGGAALVDLPGQAMNAAGGVVQSGLEMVGFSPEVAASARRSYGMMPMGTGTTAAQGMAVASGGASEYQPKTTAGEYASTVGEFLPGAALGGGGIGGVIKYGVAPALASEAAGQATKGTKAEPYARLAAAIATPLGINALNKAGRAIVSPNGGVDPERLKMAQVLDDFGVPMTAGQRTGSVGLRKAEGGTSRGQAVMDEQADAFTAAALKVVGTDATRATPEALEATAQRIGKDFDAVMAGVDVTPDAAVLGDLATALATYRSLAPKNTNVPLLGNINREMVQAFRSGNPIPAGTLGTWRSSLSKLTANPDTATRDAAVAALDAIDNAMNTALVGLGRADDVAKLATARSQWRNFLAIQKAASRAGENMALGIISPSSLRNELTNQGRAAMARGRRGDLGALARAGEAVIKPLPAVSAGGVRNIPGMSAMLGGAGGAAVGGPVGAIAGMLAPAAINAARMTRPMQNYLSNQLVAPGGPVFAPNALSIIPGLTAQ